MNLVELAQRIKRLRTERGLTLQEVADQAGLTRGWLSKVENFRVTPSLPALANIAVALGVPLSELVAGLDERPRLVVVRREERTVLRRDEDVSALEYEALAPNRPMRGMDPFIVRVPPEYDRPCLTHHDEEFMHVLHGTLRLEYGERSVQLEVGDSAYFDGDEPHRVVCVGETPAEVLIVFHRASGNSSRLTSEPPDDSSA